MRFSLERLWLWLAIALPALAALVVPLPAVDLAYQVRAGDAILATGAIPAVDTWTFTVAGVPWTDQQWLAQVLLAVGYRVGGWELLAVLRAGLVAAAFGLLAAAAIARGSGARTAAALSLLAFALAAPALALRPQLFGILIFATLLLLVADRGRHPRVYWLAPALVALWANVHGSFVLAPVVLGYAWLDDLARGRPSRGSLLVLVVGIGATLLNPFGAGVWVYAAGIGADPAITGRASEWQRTTPFTVPGLLYYLSALGGLLVAVRGRAGLRWPDWLWLVAMFAIGAWTVRGLAWWPFALAFVVAAALPVVLASAHRRVERPGFDGTPDPDEGHATPAGRRRQPGYVNGLLALVLGATIIVLLPWWRPVDPLTGRQGLLTYAPSGLAGALGGHVTEGIRVFAPQVWTSWFEWAEPRALAFMDSRFELFPDDVWEDYDEIVAGGAGSAAILDRWAIEVVVLPADGVPPAGAWTEVYRDADGAILVRAGG